MSNGKAVFGMLLCLAASTVCVSGQTLPPELQAKQNFGLQREPQLVSRWIEDLMEPVSANHIRSSRQTPDIDVGQLVIEMDAGDTGDDWTLTATAYDAVKKVSHVTGCCGEPLVLKIPNANRSILSSWANASNADFARSKK